MRIQALQGIPDKRHSKERTFHLVFIAGLLLFTGCAQQNDASQVVASTQDSLTANQMIAGTWRTSCLVPAGPIEQGWRATIIAKTDGTFSYFTEVFNNVTCEQLTLNATATGTFFIGESVTGLTDTYAVDITFTKSGGTPVINGNILQNIRCICDGNCDAPAWAVGTEIVFNTDCSKFAIPANDSKRFDIFKITKKIDQTILSFGDRTTLEKDGKSVSNRPIIINPSVSFIKQ